MSCYRDLPLLCGYFIRIREYYYDSPFFLILLLKRRTEGRPCYKILCKVPYLYF